MPFLSLFTFNIIRILVLSALGVFISLILGPFLIRFLQKIKFWKKEARTKTITGEEAQVFYSLHKEREITVPRGGGVLIWFSVLVVIFLCFALSFISQPWWLKKFNFLSRGETWLPFFTLIAGSIVGLIDDTLTVYGSPAQVFLQKIWVGKGKYIGGGMGFKRRLIIIILIGLIGGWWFYFKLGWDTIHLPLIFNFPEGINLPVGIWIIPLFVLVQLASWAGGVIDGLDGLSGGVFASIFAAFSIIAFSQGKSDLATFCAVILGTLFSFL